MRVSLFIVTLLGLAPGLSFADDKPGKPEMLTYRVTGLFSKDREKDLQEAFKELPGIALVAINFDDAEITIELIPTKVFPDAKPNQILERLDQKIRSVTKNTFALKPKRTISRDKLEEVVIVVSGLDCKACCLAAYESIAGIDGVEQATASFKEGKVTALIDPKKTDRTKLEEALRRRGVQVAKP